jgi:hypothetical protein
VQRGIDREAELADSHVLKKQLAMASEKNTLFQKEIEKVKNDNQKLRDKMLQHMQR